MIDISVVVPTFKRQKILARCIEALIKQTLQSSKYEIIIADDEGSPETKALVEMFSVQHPKHFIKYLKVEGTHGPAAARNQGWRHAAGRVIAFTDDDCIPDKSWLNYGLTILANGKEAAWGKLIMPLSLEPTDFEWNAAQLSRAEFVTANCFCLKSVLHEIGGFDERFKKAWREDSDLYFTLLEHKKRIDFIPQAIIYHPVPKAPFAFCLKQQKNNLYEALLFKKHPELYRQKAFFADIYYYYAAVLAFLAWIAGILSRSMSLVYLSGFIWMTFFFLFFFMRLRYRSKSPQHVAEMFITSFLIPPLSIMWRLAGAFRYRVIFW
jgi:glycosyltransferase involved in cell wall biosynthesis